MIIATIKIMSFTILLHNTPCPSIGGWDAATVTRGGEGAIHGCYNRRGDGKLDVVIYRDGDPRQPIYFEVTQ